MEKLYYSVKEKIAFWITDGESEAKSVEKTIDSLFDNAQTFASEIGVDIKNVKVFDVRKGRFFLHKKVFFAENIKTPPKNSDPIPFGPNWSMKSWLHY